LLVAQNTSIQGWSPFSNLESDFAPERNPSSAAECQHALGRVDIYRIARAVPTRWIMAEKLSSVFS
jgi:hypothetical protein